MKQERGREGNQELGEAREMEGNGEKGEMKGKRLVRRK